ncbi:DUF2243 domain-containing protein [Sorangium sp. So ce315]|uniref:DUF2243 domain-containing protein n=1 Tax=Sorangium sp. So ce315 TaxID=3133299 RepID=UPI003F5E2A74
MGAGGLIDGILFHRLLQVASPDLLQLPPGSDHRRCEDDVRKNVFAEGLFSAVALRLSVAGVGRLWSALRAPIRWTGRSRARPRPSGQGGTAGTAGAHPGPPPATGTGT